MLYHDSSSTTFEVMSQYVIQIPDGEGKTLDINSIDDQASTKKSVALQVDFYGTPTDGRKFRTTRHSTAPEHFARHSHTTIAVCTGEALQLLADLRDPPSHDTPR
jgi:hypothetical protein